MGAYYEAVLTSNDTPVRLYNPNSGLKLMEHSFIGDEYVLCIMEHLLNIKSNVVWLCDYHQADDITDLLWDNTEKMDIAAPEELTTETPYFIVNHTKKIYIDISELVVQLAFNADYDGWSIHPIPILCNSETGPADGRDYHKEDARRATWCGDLLEVVLEKPSEFRNVTQDCLFYE